MPSESRSAVARVYALITNEDSGRVCKDIPEAACNDQPGNFFKHVASLGLTKTGDGLVDPKLVLSWLLAQLGASAAAIGWLVPVREAGALLPQLGIAAWIRARPLRKYVWALGSAVQGLAVLGMAGVAWSLEGTTAGWSIVALLALFAVARSACSVSYKDVLGKTVVKSTRGTATGTANTIAATLVFAFGAALATGVLPTTIPVVVATLCIAGGCWLFAAAAFTTLEEVPGATGGGGNPLSVVLSQFGLLGRDGQLVRFIATRALLVATALAPPYMLQLGIVVDTDTPQRAIGQLGPFVIASSAASVLSSYVWGRLSDRSSRRVLLYSALVGAAVLSTTGVLGTSTPDALRLPGVLPALLFVLMVAYQGVRIGRATHIVDMASADERAAYTALSNSILGVVLLVTGVFGLLAQAAGGGVVLLAFGAMCAGAAVCAAGLREVQAE